MRAAIERKAGEWATVVASIAGTWWLWSNDKPPGYAVALLAVMAAVVTVINPGPLQKGLVIILAGALFFLETRAIDRDHIQQQRDATAQLGRILSDNRDKTALMMQDSREKTKIILNTERKQFSTLVIQDRSIFRLSARNLLNVTGGDSFPYVRPQWADATGAISLLLVNHGKYALTGVTVSILSLREPARHGPIYQVGNVPGHGFVRIPLTITPLIPDKGTDTFDVYLTAQTGMINQTIAYSYNAEHKIKMETWVTPIDLNLSDPPKDSARLFKPVLHYAVVE
jgi:hypothetical protein